MNHSDPENMLSYIDALPEDFEKAWVLGHELPLPEVKDLRQIVISGMGGSAIGGDFLASYLADRCPVPIISRRNYGLPAFARGPETLVVCSSHSGNTEETVSGFKTAQDAGCSVLALCTGGYLADLTIEHKNPLWLFEHHGQPRTAIPYSFGLLLALVERLGLVQNVESEVVDAIATMRTQRGLLTDSSPLAQNPSRRLAGQLQERNVAIFGAGENEVIARRWKTQINELAKSWASFEGLPEMNHNTLAGLLNPESLYERTSAIFLRAPLDHQRNQMRLDATMQAFLQAGVMTDAVWAKGTTKLAQMWSLLQFGDYVSYYLALLYEVDPTPVESLTALKQRLSKS
ncbi:MAG: bifunctional phosphoglucose/phosphomannose isomerase [Anaerolineaceae bacterium]